MSILIEKVEKHCLKIFRKSVFEKICFLQNFFENEKIDIFYSGLFYHHKRRGLVLENISNIFVENIFPIVLARL